jgi:ADP-ribosylglycohydrolase
MNTHETRLSRARISLEGLSVGDSLGMSVEYEYSSSSGFVLLSDGLPQGEWRYSDDTNMALSIYAILRRYKLIDQDALAKHFSDYFEQSRAYSMGAQKLLTELQNGGDWRFLSKELFGGGSFGNGGAMRAAPLGAYFADDMYALIENARLSTEITHAHPEGIAGAVAIAVAAGIACNLKGQEKPSRQEFIEAVLTHISESEVKSGIKRAKEIQSTEIRHVVSMIGNGSRISAQDTVPFVLFCAGEWLDNYEEAIWKTMSGGGDVDTTCAMVGGIVACYTGLEGIPKQWLAQCEKLPQWIEE